MLFVNKHLKIPLAELDFSFVRSSGPGGQNVNKVSTKAILRWAVSSSPSLPESIRVRFLDRYKRRITKEGDFILSSQRFRNRGRNVADCLEKLRKMLDEVSAAPRARKQTKPTKSANEKRLREKKLLSGRKKMRRNPSDDG